jgi:hypothetical protein
MATHAMQGLTRMVSGVLVSCLAASCWGYPPPWRPSTEVGSGGPDAVTFWRDHERWERKRPVAEEEIAAFTARLRAAVEAHITARPDLGTDVKKALRDLTVAAGMSYGEVRLLVGEPRERSVAPDRLRYHAWHRWPILMDRVDEVWVYRQFHNVAEYTTYAVYLRKGIVVAVVEYSWGLL